MRRAAAHDSYQHASEWPWRPHVFARWLLPDSQLGLSTELVYADSVASFHLHPSTRLYSHPLVVSVQELPGGASATDRH
jgi:hypothetical protein